MYRAPVEEIAFTLRHVAGLKPDFSVTTMGGLQSVDLASKAITPSEGATELSMTDGVGKLGDTIIFNDNPSGKIYAYSGGKATELANAGAGAGDISANADMIYVPLMQAGEVVALKVE